MVPDEAGRDVDESRGALVALKLCWSGALVRSCVLLDVDDSQRPQMFIMRCWPGLELDKRTKPPRP